MNPINYYASIVWKQWHGICLCQSFIGMNDNGFPLLKFKCIKGHEFKRSTKDITQGKFCKICKAKNKIKACKEIVEDGVEIVKNITDTGIYVIKSFKTINDKKK